MYGLTGGFALAHLSMRQAFDTQSLGQSLVCYSNSTDLRIKSNFVQTVLS